MTENINRIRATKSRQELTDVEDKPRENPHSSICIAPSPPINLQHQMDPQYALQIDQDPVPPTKQTRQVKRSNVLLSLVWTTFCPCIPVAQVSSAAGRGYWFALASYSFFYLGGIFCYGTSMTMHKPVYKWDSAFTITPYIAAWVLYILGPWATVVFDTFIIICIHIRPSWDDLYEDIGISTAAIALVVLHALAHVYLVYDVAKLRALLRLRVPIKPLHCQSICCPSCSVAHSVAAAKASSDTSVCNMGPLDELPAYQ